MILSKKRRNVSNFSAALLPFLFPRNVSHLITGVPCAEQQFFKTGLHILGVFLLDASQKNNKALKSHNITCMLIPKKAPSITN